MGRSTAVSSRSKHELARFCPLHGSPMTWLRLPTVVILAVLVLLPVGFVVYQSFLDEPFFPPAAVLTRGLYEFIRGEPDFTRAFRTTVILAVGMTAIAVPLGAVLA